MERAPLDPDLVRSFVIAAHGDLAQVQEMLEREPQLVHATWDWGGGDWESALGGAAHTGQREIALTLLAHGAHLDIFAAAMLGYLEVVQAIAARHPDALQHPGPHGIPLLVHAQAGGEEAAAVVAWLEETV